MSFDVLRWAKAQPIKDSQGKGVLLALAEHADKMGICFPSIPTLALVCGKDPSTVRRHLRKLEAAGYILTEFKNRDNGSSTSNTYLLLMGQSQPIFFEADCGGTPADCGGDPGSLRGLEPPENPQVTSLSLEPDEFEKASPRELLEAVLDLGLLETLLTEKPQRQILWLGHPPELIADAIQKANEGRGKLSTNLIRLLDISAGLIAPRTSRGSAPPKNPPSAAPKSAAPGGEHQPDHDRAERERTATRRREEAQGEQETLLDELLDASVPDTQATSLTDALYTALLQNDQARADELRSQARRVKLEAQARAVPRARDGPQGVLF